MMIKLKNNRNIASVSWSDHLVFGEDDGRLLTPGALHRRVKMIANHLLYQLTYKGEQVVFISKIKQINTNLIFFYSIINVVKDHSCRIRNIETFYFFIDIDS